MIKQDFSVVEEFEKKIAEFFGAPYAVAVDSCTHALELCLRLAKAKYITCPRNTYLSVPMLAHKLRIPLFWRERDYSWSDYYNLHSNIYDAAVLWRRNSYIENTMMCISMQYQKHLSVGRLGIILLDDREKAFQLKKMSYDGRLPNIPWREQDIDTVGYHYYATPETAQIALSKLDNAINTESRKWIALQDWPDLTGMVVFQNKYQKIYNQLIERAQSENRVRGKKIYYESHHIIPRCFGSSNDKSNRVLLTAKEHFICHKLLVRIYPNEKSLKLALWRMVNSTNEKRNYKVSAREFEYAKSEMAKISRDTLIKLWANDEHRESRRKSISRGQKLSYKKNPGRAKKLSDSQKESYKNSTRATRLSETQIKRYRDPSARLKTGMSIKNSKKKK